MDSSMPGLPVHYQLLEFTQIHVHWVGDAIQPSHPLSSPSPLAFNLSQHQGLFTSVSSLHEVAKVLEFQLQHQSVNIQNWFPLQLTAWISLQSKGLSRVFSNTTIQKHQFFGAQLFFIVQLSNPYMTTGKTIALTRWTFIDKVMSLFFNMLSRLVITFLSRSKCLLISWPQSPSAVILEPPKNKVCHCFHHFPKSICCKVMGPDAMILVFWVTPRKRNQGKFGLGVQNEAGQRLIEFCQEKALVIANTLFQQHKRRLYTWTSPDGQYWNQIDYILCS